MLPETRRRLFKRGLALGIACALSLIGAELVLRYTSLGEVIYYNAPIYVGERETQPNELFAPDANLGWRMHANSQVEFPTEGRMVEYRSNANGFRSGTSNKDRVGTKRIAIVGDSFAWGFGVHWNETGAVQLESMLDDSAVELFAMPGFGLDQIAQSVRHVALPSHPDLIVTAIFSDDLSRCFTAYREKERMNKPLLQLDDGELIHSTEEDKPGAIQLYAERELELYALLWHVRRVVGKRHALGSWWALNSALLDRIIDDAEAAQVPVLFVHIPKRTGNALPALADHLRARGAALIDLSDDSHEPLKDLYFKEDGHFNPEGHCYFAKVVHEWIHANMPELE